MLSSVHAVVSISPSLLHKAMSKVRGVCNAEFSGFCQFMSQYQQCLSTEGGLYLVTISDYIRDTLFFPLLIAEQAVLWLLEFRVHLT